MKKIKILILSMAACATMHMQAVIVGSNASVSIQSHVTFPAADADNAILGFAWMQNGFSLEDASTVCTFNSIYPYSGPLDLRGGTLVLNQDFVLKDMVPFYSSGTFIGNGHNVDYSGAALGSLIDVSIDSIYQDVDVFLPVKADFTLSHTLIFRGQCSLIGASPSITGFNSNAVLLVDSHSSLTIKNMILDGVQGQNIRCVDDTASIIFDNATIIQTGDFTFSIGSMSFFNNVDWQGSYTFLYDSIQSSTIQKNSTLHITDGFTFALGRSAVGAVEPLVFTDQSSVLNLDQASLYITSYGAQFTKGTLATSNLATIEVVSTSTARALEFGNGIAADDMVIQLNGGSDTIFSSGLAIFNNVAAQLLQGNLHGATVTLGAQSISSFQNSYHIDDIIYNPSPIAIIEIAAGKQLLLNNVTTLTPNGGSYVVTGFFIPGIGFLLDGNQSMDVVSGSLPLALLIDNAGNLLNGAGEIAYPIILADSNAQLTWGMTGRLDADMFLNGGSLVLSNLLNLGNHILLRGAGTVHLGNSAIYPGNISYTDPGFTWTSQLYFDGSIGSISLSSDLKVENTWTFSGEVWFIGNEFNLDISDGAIVIEKGSTIHFHNVSLIGLAGSNIRCLDDFGTVICEGTALTLDADFTFTRGNLAFWDPVPIQPAVGSATFAFQSDMPCTFNKTAQLILDTGITFSYDTASPDLLQFDPKAQIILNGGNFFAAQDVNLIHATMQVQAFGGFSSASNASMTLGDCVNPANDFAVLVSSGGQLDVASGTLNYENINASSLLMQNFFSNIFMHDGTTLNLYKSLDVGTGFITFGNATLGRAPGQFIIGPVNEQGVLTIASLLALPSC